MLFKDLRQLIILILIIFVIVAVIQSIRQLIVKRIYRKGLLSYNVYSALNFLCIDAIIQTIIFLLFDWYISVIMWILTIPLCVLLFVFLYKSKYSENKYKYTTQEFQNRNQDALKPQKTAILLYNNLGKKEYTNSSFLFHTATFNPKSCICWLYVHLSAPALIWINILLEQIGMLPQLTFSNTFVTIFYDMLCSYGLCSIVYWVGYLLYPMSIRYENWRRWYHIIYFVFYVIWWFFFILIEIHMFN